MAESNSKLSAPLQKFAADLKTMLTKTETQIRELRAREASTKARKLEKHELCPLCGGPDVNGRCACVEHLKKNDGADVEGGEGTQPMGMSEKLAKCGSCGKMHSMGKCDLSEVKPGKVIKGEGAETAMVGGALGKMGMPTSSAAALPGGYSSSAGAQEMHDREHGTAQIPFRDHIGGSSTGFGGSSPHHIEAANREIGGFKSLIGGNPAPGGATLAPSTKMNVGTAGRRAGNVQAPVSGTIANAKAEKNFGSARSPLGTGAPGHATQTNMPSQLKAGMAPVSKKELPVVQSVPTKPVAGAKLPKKGTDKTPAKQGSGGEIKKGSALGKSDNDDHTVVCPKCKGKDTGRVKCENCSGNRTVTRKGSGPVRDSKSPYAGVRGAAALARTEDGLSKGEPAKKSAAKAAKPAATAKAPKGKGVGGKQPVGQGGGDAHKVAGGAPKVAPKPAAAAPASRFAPAAAPKPGAGAGLRAAGAAEVGRQKGNANIQRLHGDLANVAAQRSTPGEVDERLADISNMRPGGNPLATDVDVSSFNQEGAPAAQAAQAARAGHDPRTAGQRMAAPRPAAPTAAAHAAAAGAAHDPRTAGQRMAGQPAAGSPQGAPDALNGVRDQMNASAKQKGGVGFLRGLFSMFHTPKQPDPTLNPAPVWQQQGQRTSARFNGARPLQRAELSLSEMEEDHKEFEKRGLKVKKGEMAPPTEGLSSINHNRRMLSVKPGSPRRSKSKR